MLTHISVYGSTYNLSFIWLATSRSQLTNSLYPTSSPSTAKN